MTSTAPQTSTTTVIDADALSVFYGNVQALRATTIGFERGRVSALIGASGSGKSTFLRALNRMHDLTPGVRVEGRVLFDGADIYDTATDPVVLRSRIGMVFQRPNPFPKSIYENVVYGSKIHGHRGANLKAIARRALTDAALFDEVKDRLDTSALSLSGGQQQRLCIARALAIDPDVLLMDEPASALDPIATSKIEDLITALRERISIIIVTHSMQQATRISDTTAFFHLGRLVEAGPTKDIFGRPKQKQTADYLSGRFG